MKKLYSLLLSILPFFSFAQVTLEEHLAVQDIGKLYKSGSKAVYCLTHKESWNTKTFSSIYLTDLTGDTKQLTSNNFDTEPKLSPNGKWVSFISNRNKMQQISIIPLSGGQPRKASDAQAYISNYKWLNDETIVYVDDEQRDSLLEAEEKQNGGGFWVDTEFYTNAVWKYNIETHKREKITDGKYRVIDFDISGNGKYLAIIGSKITTLMNQ